MGLTSSIMAFADASASASSAEKNTGGGIKCDSKVCQAYPDSIKNFLKFPPEKQKDRQQDKQEEDKQKQQEQEKKQQEKQQQEKQHQQDKQDQAQAPIKSKETAAESEDDKVCPPDGFELGRSTWTFLHTTAAYYPQKPSKQDEQFALALVNSISRLYPCSDCASHLREYLAKNPVKADSQRAFSLWMCVMHNDVNKRLGKPQFDCSKTDERWKDGPSDGSCY